MNFEDLRVGMMVKAIDNNYALTTKSRKWVGTVTKVCGNGTFYAVTESSVSKTEKGQRYDCLRPEHFEPVSREKRKIDTADVVVKVVRVKDTYHVIYNGKTVASATCREDDNFNEEFGINLALRRFCKTLCDENTTKKVIYNTDNVEDFI